MDAERFASLVGEPVTVSFSDGGTEQGWLQRADGDDLVVRHIDMAGGGHMWTATYSMTGDEDTPRVVGVAPVPTPAELAQEPLF